MKVSQQEAVFHARVKDRQAAEGYNPLSVIVSVGHGDLGEARVGLGPSRESSFVLSAQLDVVALSLPAVFLASVIRGGSGEVAPVR